MGAHERGLQGADRSESPGVLAACKARTKRT